MQIIYDFKISISEYSKNGENNAFPEFAYCQRCKAQTPMIKNGFYSRYVITPFKTFLISIRRYRCPECGKTIFILPLFLIPGFQYSLTFIFQGL